MLHAVPLVTTTLLAGLPEFLGAELGDRALRRAYADAGLFNGFKATAGVYVPETTIISILESAARQAGDGALGGVDGFDQDERGGKSDECSEVSCRLLAA